MKYNWRIDTEEVKRLYYEWYSCGQIWKILWASRQAIWEKMKNNWIESRKKRILPYIIYDWIKFTANWRGYYRSTEREKHISLHRYKWTKEVWEIPEWYDVHHKDEDKQNNDISNFECMLKWEHSRYHWKKRYWTL